MIIRAFLAAGILAAACLAGSPPATAQPAPTCAPMAGMSMASATVNVTGSNATPGAGGIISRPEIRQGIIDAYNIAPAFFQRELCGLDGIYVVQAGDPWGFRNITDGKRYIALSMQGSWDQSLAPISFNQYQNRIFGPDGLGWPASDPSPPTYLPASPNSGTLAVLSALAHEFGHVLYADTVVSPRGTPPQTSRFCGGILTDKNENGAKVAFWRDRLQPGIWKHYGDIDPNYAAIPDDPSDPPAQGDPGPADASIPNLKQKLSQGDIAQAHRILGRVMAKGRPFPSVFGAFSANEEFVETFMLYVLMRAQTPLTHMPLRISSTQTVDVPATLASRHRLSQVLQCFDALTR